MEYIKYCYEYVKDNDKKYTLFAVVWNKSDLKEIKEVDEEISQANTEEINSDFILVFAK